MPLQTARPVRYDRSDPEAARDLFIRHALVAGEWDGPHRFVEHNAAVLDEALELESRYRRSDILVDDETVVDFFSDRIPDDIVSVRHFDRWWKEARQENPHRLDLSLDDLIDPDADAPDDAAFPRIWQYGDVTMPIEYEYDPSSARDGATIDVPIGGLAKLDPAVFEWHVPGMREELVIALMRSLPKQYRKRLSPIPETARSILAGHEPAGEGLIPFLRRELTHRAGVPIPFDAFDLERIPSHLIPTFRVVDEDGATIAEGSDLAVLRSELSDRARAAMSTSGHEVERTGLTAWDFGDLPDSVEIGPPGQTVIAYPALFDEDDSVAVRLFATPAEQDEAMWNGTRRLLLLNLPSPAKRLRPLVTADGLRAVADGPDESFGAWADDCLSCAVDAALIAAGGPAWDAASFARLLRFVRDETDGTLIDVASDSLEILDLHLEIREAMKRYTAAPYEDAIADIDEQLDRLLYPGVLTAIGAKRLPDLLRYLRGIDRRLEQLRHHVGRDAERMDRVRSLEARHDALTDAVPGNTALIEVAWMLQELRVSLFAQQIGTKGKVGEKRIIEAMERAVAP